MTFDITRSKHNLKTPMHLLFSRFSNVLKLTRTYLNEHSPSKILYIPSRKMSIFIQKSNPMTGENDWIVQEEDYDYHQEVARSSFADMLHDTERNQKYEKALKDAIDIMHGRGKKANVLDIGTGTGLLSMMAAKHGADAIVACEGFGPMSECALKVIERNGYRDKIKIIPKRSTDITVGPDCDMTAKCNILVTEVFDTELIGEGALLTFSHAHKCLLEKDCIVVPQSATIYAQVVESTFVQNWNKIQNIRDKNGKVLVEVPQNIQNCAGSASVHDLQLSQLNLDQFSTIIPPLPVFRFDWSGATPFVFDRATIHNVKSERTGTAQAVFMWWDLQMDTKGKIMLSCAPYWAHILLKENQEKDSLPWRDHWMQAIYYLPREVEVQKGQELNLISSHDEFSLWFNLKTDLKLKDLDYSKPICECGLHVAFSRTRIGQLNDSQRNLMYLEVLEKHVTTATNLLVLGDGFYLSLAAAKFGAKKIYYVESNYLSRRILLDFVESNELDNVEVLESIESLQSRSDVKDINLVFGEPYSISTILPWDNLTFAYSLNSLKGVLSSDLRVFPEKAVIKALAVNFDDLHKIRLPLELCEGFSLQDFDELIETSSSISDDNVEAQPLWEYPGIALGSVIEITSIDCRNIPTKIMESRGVFEIHESLGGCNGIALWVDWIGDENLKDSVISSGPTTPPVVGKYIDWYKYTRQGVYLFPKRDVKQIDYEFLFNPVEGSISFNCR